MRAISVRQPWAWAICEAGKDVENRSTPFTHRGPLLIHASGTKDVRDASRAFIAATARLEVPEELPTGAYVGVADLVDAHRISPGCCDSPWGEQTMGRVHLVLRDGRPLAMSVPGFGRLGLWAPSPNVMGAIEEVMT